MDAAGFVCDFLLFLEPEFYCSIVFFCFIDWSFYDVTDDKEKLNIGNWYHLGLEPSTSRLTCLHLINIIMPHALDHLTIRSTQIWYSSVPLQKNPAQSPNFILVFKAKVWQVVQCSSLILTCIMIMIGNVELICLYFHREHWEFCWCYFMISQNSSVIITTLSVM